MAVGNITAIEKNPLLLKKPQHLVLAFTKGSEYEVSSLLTFAQEGGYANDPNDPGGETNYGISKRSYPNEDIKALTIERAKYLGKRDFWYPMRLDALNCQMLANNLFDFAFHHGVRGVGKKLQLVLARDFDFKGSIDGIIGGETMDYINAMMNSGQGAPFALHQAMMKARIDYYLAYAPPQYLKGFITRANFFM